MLCLHKTYSGCGCAYKENPLSVQPQAKFLPNVCKYFDMISDFYFVVCVHCWNHIKDKNYASGICIFSFTPAKFSLHSRVPRSASLDSFSIVGGKIHLFSFSMSFLAVLFMKTHSKMIILFFGFVVYQAKLFENFFCNIYFFYFDNNNKVAILYCQYNNNEATLQITKYLDIL